MKLLKYFFKKGMLPIYAAIGILFGGAVAYVTDSKISVFFILSVFCLALFLRFTDDIFDYERDKGKKPQHLTKITLCLLALAAALLFTVFNVIVFRLLGFLSIIFVLYALAQEKFVILQGFFAFFYSLYSIALFILPSFDFTAPIGVFLALSLIIPIFFGIYKRSKRK